MIGATGEAVLTGLIEIVAEVLVDQGASLCGLDHHETDRTLVDGTVVFQLAPVNATLMMGDVYAVDLIALGIVDGAIKGTPPEPEGSHEEIVEEPDVAQDDSATTNPPSP